jgi:hypothetical protein
MRNEDCPRVLTNLGGATEEGEGCWRTPFGRAGKEDRMNGSELESLVRYTGAEVFLLAVHIRARPHLVEPRPLLGRW